MKSENILGYPVTTINKAECIHLFHSWIVNKKSNKYYVGLNPHSLILADSDECFKNAVLNADLIVPDGSGILFASRLFGGRIKERITGKPDVLKRIVTPEEIEEQKIKEELNLHIEDVAREIVAKENADIQRLKDEYDKKLEDLENSIPK